MAAGATMAAAIFSSTFLANEARTEAADIMAAATATALAAENVRKEVAGLFAEAVAATAAAATSTTYAAEEKKEAELQLAVVKAVLIEASIKEAASDRALAGVGALEISMEEALAMARAKTAEAALATANAKRAGWNASKRSAIRSSDAEHGTLAFVKWRRRQRDAIVDWALRERMGIGFRHRRISGRRVQNCTPPCRPKIGRPSRCCGGS